MAFPVLLRGDAQLSFKGFGKIVNVKNSAMLSNGLYLKFCCCQKAHCKFYSFLVDIFGKSLAGFLAEKRGKIAWA